MAKRFYSSIALLLLCISANATNTIVDSLLTYGLPVVVINTVNNEEPTSEIVDAPEGCFGQSITNATKVPGRVLVISPSNDTIFDSGEYEKKKSGMTIKHRGNTSASMNLKKPFKIKLQKKGDMLGRGDNYADKNWALLNPHLNFNNFISTEILRLMHQTWVPAMEYVNVVFNGDYRGLYMLSETVERNTKCRVNTKKNGYIIENDPYWWNEDKYFSAVIDTIPYKFTFKYPDPDDLTDDQMSYIKGAATDMEQSIIDGTYDKYIDVASFAVWILFHDIINDSDPGGANRYITKYDSTEDSKFTMGPVWDFDAAFKGNIGQWAPIHNEFYYIYLFNSNNKAFAKAYVEEWNSIKDSLFVNIHNYLTDYKSSEKANSVYKSWIKNEAKWDVGSTLTEKDLKRNIEKIDNMLSQRKMELDKLIAAIDTTTTSNDISSFPFGNDNNKEYKTYNLLGQEVLPRTKGIVIMNGRKYLNK